MIIHGDCLEEMRKMESNSVTAIITDPPYALEFMGKGWDKVLPSEEIWREALRVVKPGGFLLSFGGTRTYHRLTCSIEDSGWTVRDCMMWLYGSGFPKSHDISKAIDKAAGAEREIIGRGRSGKNAGMQDLGPSGIKGGEYGITAPATPLSQTWDGYGTVLKPAWEPIVVAMKPLDGTFAQNAQEHGVAGINVDGCRVGNEKRINSPASQTSASRKSRVEAGYRHDDGKGPGSPAKEVSGRFPANLILDEEAGKMLDEQSGILKSHGGGKATYGGTFGNGKEVTDTTAMDRFKGDSGGASRFFYCAKASKKERGEGNKHPTVKPLELMRYLVRLVTMPTGAIILDPFMGSGTTGLACKEEGVNFIGIEKDEKYFQIAKDRINGK